MGELFRALSFRKDVIYVMVTQYDTGPLAILQDADFFSNWLIFSAGGWGNVPVPLLNGRIIKQGLLHRPRAHAVPSSSDPDRGYQHVLSFAGRTTYKYQIGIPQKFHELRVQALASLRASMPSHLLTVQEWRPTDEWVAQTERSLLTLAFRGYGATSFCMYEAMHLGSVPVYAWSNLLWLPYRRAKRPLWGPEGVAFIVEVTQLGTWCATQLCPAIMDPLAQHAANDGGMGVDQCMGAWPSPSTLAAVLNGTAADTSASTVAQMRARLPSVLRDYFTFPSLMRHMEALLAGDPDAELACQPKPGIVFVQEPHAS